MSRESVTDSTPPSSEARPSDTLRLAVLPFENLSRDPSDEWISVAFSDSLTFGLRDLTNLVLVSRERLLEHYRHESLPEGGPLDLTVIKHLCRSLSLRYYIHGSFQRVGTTLRVLARLVEAHSEVIAAQEAVTRPIGDILAIQDELARLLANVFAVTPPTGGSPRIVSLPAYRHAIEAQRLYVTGDYVGAADQLQAAIGLNPGYAEAWAAFSKCQARLAQLKGIAGGEVAIECRVALRAAQRSVELAPSSYEAHVALAIANREAGDVESWRVEAETSRRLNPRIAEACALLGDAYSAIPMWGFRRVRNPDLAERYYRDSLELDPGWYAAYTSLMTELLWTGRAAAALAVANMGLEALPGHPRIRAYRGFILLFLGNVDEGELELIGSIQEQSASAFEQIFLAMLDLKRGRAEAASRRFSRILATADSAVMHVLIGYGYFANHLAEAGAQHLARAFTLDADCLQYVARSSAVLRFNANSEVRTALQRLGIT